MQCAHLEKSWSESQWEGWHPIYEMENKTCSKPPTSDVSEAGVCVYTCYWYKGYVCWLHDNSALFSWDMLGVVDEIPCEELVFAARFVQQRITPTICLENSSFVIYSNNIWLLYGYYTWPPLFRFTTIQIPSWDLHFINHARCKHRPCPQFGSSLSHGQTPLSSSNFLVDWGGIAILE